MRSYKKSFKGFTLIEVLVATAIFFLILISIYNYFINANNSMQKQSNTVNIDLQAKKLQDTIKQWLMMADQGTIEYLPISNSVLMDVYEDATTKRTVKIWFDINEKALKIMKNYDYNNAGTYLKGRVLSFNVANDANLISISFDVDFGNNKRRTYTVLHYRRIY